MEIKSAECITDMSLPNSWYLKAARYERQKELLLLHDFLPYLIPAE